MGILLWPMGRASKKNIIIKLNFYKKKEEGAQEQKRSKFYRLPIPSDGVCVFVCVCVVNNGGVKESRPEYVIFMSCRPAGNGGKFIYL